MSVFSALARLAGQKTALTPSRRAWFAAYVAEHGRRTGLEPETFDPQAVFAEHDPDRVTPAEAVSADVAAWDLEECC